MLFYFIAYYLVLSSALNKELSAMDSSQIFTAKEVRSKLETVKFNHLQSTPPPTKLIPRECTPVFDQGMISNSLIKSLILYYILYYIILLFYLNYYYFLTIILSYLILVGRTIFQNTYESPHLIDTDVDQLLMVWPMCDGRDVNVTIQEEELSIEVNLAPLAYDLINCCLLVLIF